MALEARETQADTQTQPSLVRPAMRREESRGDNCRGSFSKAPPVHIHPVRRQHLTDGTPCWCGPEMKKLCPQCSDDGSRGDCWLCEGLGLVPTATHEAADLVIHRDL